MPSYWYASRGAGLPAAEETIIPFWRLDRGVQPGEVDAEVWLALERELLRSVSQRKRGKCRCENSRVLYSRRLTLSSSFSSAGDPAPIALLVARASASSEQRSPPRRSSCSVGGHSNLCYLCFQVGIWIMPQRSRGKPVPHMSEGLPYPIFKKRRENIRRLLIESPKTPILEEPVMDLSMVTYSSVPLGGYCANDIHPLWNKGPGCAKASRNGPGRE